MYLFDTDIISNMMKKGPSPALLSRMREIPAAHQHSTAINLGELIYGALKSKKSDYYLKKIKHILIPNITILPFDTQAAEIYARIRAHLEASGVPLSEPDLRIAAIAISENLTLITGNLTHFARISELKAENWL